MEGVALRYAFYEGGGGEDMKKFLYIWGVASIIVGGLYSIFCWYHGSLLDQWLSFALGILFVCQGVIYFYRARQCDFLQKGRCRYERTRRD